MRIFITLACLALTSTLFAQGMVAISNTSFVAGGMLNDSSFAISSTEIAVEVVPRDGDIRVGFDNKNAQDMTGNVRDFQAKREIEINWDAHFTDLEIMLESNVYSKQQREGTVTISIGDITQELPATLTLQCIKGTQGVTSIVTMEGTFNPNDFEMDSSEYKWDDQLTYTIIFRATAY